MSVIECDGYNINHRILAEVGHFNFPQLGHYHFRGTRRVLLPPLNLALFSQYFIILVYYCALMGKIFNIILVGSL